MVLGGYVRGSNYCHGIRGTRAFTVKIFQPEIVTLFKIGLVSVPPSKRCWKIDPASQWNIRAYWIFRLWRDPFVYMLEGLYCLVTYKYLAINFSRLEQVIPISVILECGVTRRGQSCCFQKFWKSPLFLCLLSTFPLFEVQSIFVFIVKRFDRPNISKRSYVYLRKGLYKKVFMFAVWPFIARG